MATDLREGKLWIDDESNYRYIFYIMVGIMEIFIGGVTL